MFVVASFKPIKSYLKSKRNTNLTSRFTMASNNQKNQRKAVVVIHGIGNQLPMATTRELVESLKDDDDILYSSPDREANFFADSRI